MRITITTGQGEVVDFIDFVDDYDLDKPAARDLLIEQIQDAQRLLAVIEQIQDAQRLLAEENAEASTTRSPPPSKLA